MEGHGQALINMRCNHCKEYKTELGFHKSAGLLHGLYPTCKACRKISARAKYVENPFKSLHRTKKSWCKSKNVKYNLTEEYLRGIWTDKCPISGVHLSIANKVGEHHKSAWLDRIDHKAGYTKGNVAFISGRMNRIKYNATVEELESIVKWMKGQGL